MLRDLRAIRQRREHGEGGFTLIEVVVALALLGIIMTPLTMAFISMIRGSQQADERLGRAADAQRIGTAWTKDVQTVEKDGINPVGVTCPGDGTAAIEVQLITFVSATSAAATDAGEPVRVASWVATGSGENTVLERRSCENGQRIATQKLATTFGVPGTPVIGLIHGPNGADRNFCPGRTVTGPGGSVQMSDNCTIVIDGAWDYQLTVSRRIAQLAGADLVQQPPGAPTITGATGLNTHIVATWTPPVLTANQPAIESYRLIASIEPEGDAVETLEVDGASFSGDLTGLNNDTPYYLRVQALNAVGWGDLSLPFGPVTPLPTTPERPTGVTVTPGDRTVTVDWTAPVNDGGSAISGWNVYLEPSSGTPLAPFSASGAPFTLPADSLMNGETYTATVRAINGLGEGDESDPSGTVVPYGIPGQATITSAASLDDGKIRLDWDAPSVEPAGAVVADGGRPVTGYRILVDSGGTQGPWPATGTFAASTTSYDIGGLTLGNDYTFVVETYNARGFSTSDPSDSQLSRSTPGVPVNVTATANGVGIVDVTWAVPSGDPGAPVLEYQVVTTPVSSTKSIAPPTTSTQFTGLTSGTTYTFRVRARTIAGWGGYGTATAQATGAPSGLGAPTVVRQSGNTYPFAVNLSWSEPSNKGGGCITKYVVDYSTNSGGSVAESRTISTSPSPSCGGEPARTMAWTNLPAGVQYRYYRVTATNTANLTTTSGWASLGMTQDCRVTTAEADAWVNEDNGGVFSSSKRGNNYGGDDELDVNKDGNSGFVRFNLASNGSACVQFGSAIPAAAVLTGSASVSLYNTSTTNNDRYRSFHRVTSGWSESGITYNNRPSTNGSYTDRKNARDGGWHTFSVNVGDANADRGGTRYGWNVRDDGGSWLANWNRYATKENGSVGRRPLIDVVFY